MLGYKVIGLVSLVTLATAQTMPACVLSCYQSSFAAAPTCTQTNFTCLCGSTAFQQAVGQCLSTTCNSEAEIQAGEQFGVTTCKSVGITIAAPSIPLNNPNLAATTPAANQATTTPVAAVTPTTPTMTTSTTTSTPTSSVSSVAAPSATMKSSGNKVQVGGVLAFGLGLAALL